MFYNDNFTKFFPEYKENSYVIEKRFRNLFFYIEKRQLNDFDQLKMELDRISSLNRESLVVLDDFLTPLIIKNEKFSNNKKFKLLTYNFPTNYPFSSNVSAFNIVINSNLIYEQIVKLIKKESHSKNLNNTLIVIDKNYQLCNDFVKYLNDNKLIPIIYESIYDKQHTMDFIGKHKGLKYIICFGYKNNNFLLDIDEDDERVYIEIFTNYGKIKNNIRYNFKINWQYALNEGLNSKEFINFIKDKKYEKKITIYKAKNKNLIYKKSSINSSIFNIKNGKKKNNKAEDNTSDNPNLKSD